MGNTYLLKNIQHKTAKNLKNLYKSQKIILTSGEALFV